VPDLREAAFKGTGMVIRYRRVDELLAVDVDDDVMIFDAVRGKYFATRGVGAVVWAALIEPCTTDELCEHVVAAYEVDLGLCRRDVQVFVDRLCRDGLVVASEHFC
jgi:hypothetical protein